MYQVITVVFTDHRLNGYDANKKTRYAFIYDGKVNKGDLLTSPDYSTKLQILNVEELPSKTIIKNGKEVVLKNLTVSAIDRASQVNNLKVEKEMVKKNSMFAGIADKYKSQWIPEKEENVKLSWDGALCVSVGEEYMGIKSDGTLTSYPKEVLIDVPVYSINKPSDQVQIGDVIKNGPNSYSKVLSRNENGSLKIMSYTGDQHDRQEAQDFFLGQAMTRVLINMFNFDANGFNPILFMLGNKENEFDIKDFVMLQMMSGNKNLFNNGVNGMNPLMLMALSDKNEGFGNDMFSLIALSQMMNGQNPLQNVVSQNNTPTVDAIVETLKKNPELVKEIKEKLNA